MSQDINIFQDGRYTFHFIFSAIRDYISAHKITLRYFCSILPPNIRQVLTFERLEREIQEDKFTPNTDMMAKNLAEAVLKITHPHLFQIMEKESCSNLDGNRQQQVQTRENLQTYSSPSAKSHHPKNFGEFNKWADIAYTVMYHWRNGLDAEDIFQEMVSGINPNGKMELTEILPKILSVCFDEDLYKGSKRISPDKVIVPADIFKKACHAEIQLIDKPIFHVWGKWLDIFIRCAVSSDKRGFINGRFALFILEEMKTIPNDSSSTLVAERLSTLFETQLSVASGQILTSKKSEDHPNASLAKAIGRFSLPSEFRFATSTPLSVPENLAERIIGGNFSMPRQERPPDILMS